MKILFIIFDILIIFFLLLGISNIIKGLYLYLKDRWKYGKNGQTDKTGTAKE